MGGAARPLRPRSCRQIGLCAILRLVGHTSAKNVIRRPFPGHHLDTRPTIAADVTNVHLMPRWTLVAPGVEVVPSRQGRPTSWIRWPVACCCPTMSSSPRWSMAWACQRRSGTGRPRVTSSSSSSPLLPLLRADFRWIYEYRYQPGQPLPVPISGLADPGQLLGLPRRAPGRRHGRPGSRRPAGRHHPAHHPRGRQTRAPSQLPPTWNHFRARFAGYQVN